MSDIKVGDKVKVQFEGVVTDWDHSHLPFKIENEKTRLSGWHSAESVTKIEPQDEQVKVNKFKVGDRVSIKGNIIDVDDSGGNLLINLDCFTTGRLWVSESHLTRIEAEKPEQKFKEGDLVVAYPDGHPIIGKVLGYDYAGRVNVVHLDNQNWLIIAPEDKIDHIKFRDNKGE